MDIFKILNNDLSGLTDEEKFYADRFNSRLKKEIINELVIYEGNSLIQDSQNNIDKFREKIELIFVNGLKGYKEMPIKTLIDIYIDKCGEESFINIIEKVSSI